MFIVVLVVWVAALSAVTVLVTAVFTLTGKPFAVCAEGAVQTWLAVIGLTTILGVILWTVAMQVMSLAASFGRLIEAMHAWAALTISILVAESVLAFAWRDSPLAGAIIAAIAFVAILGQIWLILLNREAAKAGYAPLGG